MTKSRAVVGGALAGALLGWVLAAFVAQLFLAEGSRFALALVVGILGGGVVGGKVGLRRHRGRLWRERSDQGCQCPTCGYDIRASISRCPECGTLIPLPLEKMRDWLDERE